MCFSPASANGTEHFNPARLSRYVNAGVVAGEKNSRIFPTKIENVKPYFCDIKRIKKKYFIALLLLLAVLWWFSLPFPLFDKPVSLVLKDRDDNLLSARIAADYQWRFPERDTVPAKFATAIIEFEDRRFYRHFGIDLRGVGRAFLQNIKERKIVSGGSTLTMQTVRLSRDNPPRTLWQKLSEMCLATRLEVAYDKAEILAFYASHAPFGGNVVGLDAAAYRYYQKRPELLSWGEAATLAVLPNSPGLIHPGRNRQALFAKRNRLLDRLLNAGKIDELTCDLAKTEPLPAAPLPLPDLAPHLADRALQELPPDKYGKLPPVNTTLNGGLQKQITDLIKRANERLKYNQIHNLAALVIDVKSGETLAYIGNAPDTGKEHGENVDIIRAPRSTGSILKPFLYAQALQDGTILPQSLLIDIPSNIGGYRPENYHENYDGRVAADRALQRSLNVPFVHLLRSYGVEKFHKDLQNIGLTTITRSPDNYGLSLILGGAEGSLWDITNAYASMARTLENFQPQSGEYRKNDFQKAKYRREKETKNDGKLLKTAPVLTAASIYQTLQVMQHVERPDGHDAWTSYGSGFPVAWKTGTSFGFRDAWAVGVTPEYAVGVWAGNADGEGRPGCIGIQAAAPVLFDIFRILPTNNAWFEPPFDEMTELEICENSGWRAGADCPKKTEFMPNGGLQARVCDYHKIIPLHPVTGERVTSACLPPPVMNLASRFVLPPVAEYYYRKRHPAYRPLPPFAEGCRGGDDRAVMQFIYPKRGARISVPKDLDGERSRTVFSVAHRQPEKTIFWYLDEDYLGSTTDFHDMELLPAAGKHLLTLTDEDGVRSEIWFEVF